MFSAEALTEGESCHLSSLWPYLYGQSDWGQLLWVTVAVFQLETP